VEHVGLAEHHMVVWEELVQAEGGEENKIVAQEILLLVRNERVVEEVVHGLQLDFLNRGRGQMESLHIFLVVEGVGRMVCVQGGVDDA
jgi:hypothetical protein